MTIWLAYMIAALTVSALFVAAGWRSLRVARSAASIYARVPEPAEPPVEAPPHSASVGDAAEAIDVALERLRSTVVDQRVRIEVAAEPGLLVRARATSLEDMTSELLALGIQAVPGGRFLFTASQQAGRIEISLSDDGPADDAELRRGQARALAQRVALVGGALDIVVRPGSGTSMTLRLASALIRPVSRTTDVTADPWPEEVPQLL